MTGRSKRIHRTPLRVLDSIATPAIGCEKMRHWANRNPLSINDFDHPLRGNRLCLCGYEAAANDALHLEKSLFAASVDYPFDSLFDNPLHYSYLP